MLRIYDEFLEDETILGLRDRSYRVHVSALVYCSKNLTDGRVSVKASKVIQVILGFPVRRHIVELVDANVWLEDTDGWEIRNYLEFNPKAETVKKERAATRDRMRKLRDRRAAEGTGEGAAEQTGEGADAVPAQSLPVLLGKSKAFVVPDILKEAS